MSLNFLSTNKTVLFVTDDALHICSASPKGIGIVDVVDWEMEDFEKHVLELITKKCGGKPILILNDMVEQHYRKEKVIKTGSLFGDKAAMVQRKLNVAFANYPVRAAFPLKDKIKKAEGQLAADIYIFAAVPSSSQFNQTMAVASKSLISIAGFGLLPVEASDMLKILSEKLSKDKKAKAAKWCVFVGQHRGGGLRQIVTKNGEIALTRMTPITEDHANHEKWSDEVNGELKSTMSYLARFGYVPSDTLDIIIITNPEAGALMVDLVDTSQGANLYTMAPYEAAKLLNVKLGRREEDENNYADILHIAWAAKKSSLILPMKSAQVDELTKPRQAVMAASVLLLATCAFLLYQCFTSFNDLETVMSDLDVAKSESKRLDNEYKVELAKKEELGFDIKLIQSSIKTKESLDSDTINVIDFVADIGNAIGKDLRIDNILIEPYDNSVVQRSINNFNQQFQNNSEPLYTTVLQLSYPSTTDIIKGNNEVQSLSERLANVLSGYNVEVTKLLKDYEYTEGLIVETGDLDTQDLSQDFIAEIKIEGPIKEPKTQ
ncbi:MAG: hypothetical protein AB8B83_06510 [Bdellovibrionales bacterium]